MQCALSFAVAEPVAGFGVYLVENGTGIVSGNGTGTQPSNGTGIVAHELWLHYHIRQWIAGVAVHG